MIASISTRAHAILTNRTARQAAQMTVLRFIGLGIGALAQIYAARQLGPEKLGISGMALAAVAQGGILVTLGANTLLVREYKEAKTHEEKQSLISAAYTLRTIITGALVLLLIAALPWLWPHPQYLLATACVLPLIFFESNQALWVLQAEEKVPAQYLANVASAVVSAVVIFALVRPSSPAGSDMLAAVCGLIVAFGLSWRFAQRTLPRFTFNRQEIAKVVRGTKWLFLSAIVTYAYTRFEQPMVGWLRSVDELGVYRSAWQIINAVTPILAIVAILVYPKLINWHQESLQGLWANQKRLFKNLLPIALLGSIVSVGVIPFVFPYVYGPMYAAAAWPCAVLLLSKIIATVGCVFGWGLWAAKKDLTMLVLMTVVAIASVASNFVLIPLGGMLAAALVNLASELAVLAASAFLMWRLAAK